MLVTEASAERLVAAMVTAGILVGIDLRNVGPPDANALELRFDGKTNSFSEESSFKGQTSDPDDWLTLKLDGTLWEMKATAATSNDSVLFKPVLLALEPVQLGSNQLSMERLADTQATLGILDDWVRWTSRQAVSSYTTPGTDPGYVMRAGLGLDNAAWSQRLDTTIWKTGSTWLSLFAEYNRVGAYFQAPNFAIRPQEPFSMPGSTTSRLGGALQQGPITLTLEQRDQQGLAQENARVKAENQIGISLDFARLWARSGWSPEAISWVLPMSAYVNVGRGRVTAASNQGVDRDTTSDLSAGFSWNRNKVFVYLGYWRSDYQSQLNPWTGVGFDGSVGYHEGRWGIDLYFDSYRSVTSPASTAIQPAPSVPQSTSQRFDTISAGLAFFSAL